MLLIIIVFFLLINKSSKEKFTEVCSKCKQGTGSNGQSRTKMYHNGKVCAGCSLPGSCQVNKTSLQMLSPIESQIIAAYQDEQVYKTTNCPNKCFVDRFLTNKYKDKKIKNEKNNIDNNIIKFKNDCNAKKSSDGKFRCPCPSEINQIPNCPDRDDNTCTKKKLILKV